MVEMPEFPYVFLVTGNEPERQKKVLLELVKQEATKIKDAMVEKYPPPSQTEPDPEQMMKVIGELTLQLAEARVMLEAYRNRRYWEQIAREQGGQ